MVSRVEVDDNALLKVSDKASFHDLIFPLVLFKLINDVLESFSKSQKGQSQWFRDAALFCEVNAVDWSIKPLGCSKLGP